MILLIAQLENSFDSDFAFIFPEIIIIVCKNGKLVQQMAQWVEMEVEKSRTERMFVRDHPTWDRFEATD